MDPSAPQSFEREPIRTGAAWFADDLRNDKSWQFEMSQSEQDELAALAEHLDESMKGVEQIELTDCELPSLGPRLQQLQEELETGRGLAILRGVPLDGRSIESVNRLFWGIALHIGTPLPQTADGKRIFNVRDEGFQTNDPRARGPSSNKKLSFHTDRCDVIGFLCLRPALEGGLNDVVSSVALYNSMLAQRPDLVEVLFRPFLYERHNVDLGNQLAVYPQPIFSLCEGHFAAFLMRVLIERAYARDDTPKMTPEQSEALEMIASLAESPNYRLEFRQERGDIVLLNNLVTLHRRTAFVDDPDPDLRRHLIRIWLSVPNSRPLDPAFAPTFGTVEGGAIRGGMRVREKA